MTVLTILALAAALTMQGERFDALGQTIPELQQAMERGDVTSVELVRQYLERIEAFDNRGPRLNSMVYLNPRALDTAAALDRERRERPARPAPRHPDDPQGQLRHARHADLGGIGRARRLRPRG